MRLYTEDEDEIGDFRFSNSQLLFDEAVRTNYFIYIPFDNNRTNYKDFILLNKYVLKQQCQDGWYDAEFDERYIGIFVPTNTLGIDLDNAFCYSFRFAPDEEMLEFINMNKVRISFDITEYYELKCKLSSIFVENIESCARSS